ncbi:MAG: hypothetical protein J7545_05095 [Roseofilum sp. SBFL]|uniref:hypothetical protein n=1 Tax=Roseofilum sp. SBFL TaxID=2821496 RepID=UPI001B1464CE|nr:hypothetical protein [Roseofilum sp. SBFL]MBP0041338.1 hypothetical protein [Roseofilum sp. SBFL]
MVLVQKAYQDFSDYSRQSYDNWQLLLKKQLVNIEGRATGYFMEGLKSILPLIQDIPNITVLSDFLYQSIGWQLWPVQGLLEPGIFFYLLSHQYFPVSTVVRSQTDFTYSPVPDLWHDIFGHIPLLFFPPYSSLIQKTSQNYLDYPKFKSAIGSLFWYTIEAGVCNEHGDRRVYGASQLSSIEEIGYAVSHHPIVIPFDLGQVLNSPVQIDKLQDYIFEIPSLDYLDSIPNQLDQYLSYQ